MILTQQDIEITNLTEQLNVHRIVYLIEWSGMTFTFECTEVESTLYAYTKQASGQDLEDWFYSDYMFINDYGVGQDEPLHSDIKQIELYIRNLIDDLMTHAELISKVKVAVHKLHK